MNLLDLLENFNFIILNGRTKRDEEEILLLRTKLISYRLCSL